MVRAAEGQTDLAVDFASQVAPLPDPDTVLHCLPVPPEMNLHFELSPGQITSCMDSRVLNPSDMTESGSQSWGAQYGFSFLWDGEEFTRYDLSGFNEDFIASLPEGLTHYRVIVISESSTDGLQEFKAHIFANDENGGATYHGSADFTSLVADYNQGMSPEDAAERAMDEFTRFLSECKE